MRTGPNVRRFALAIATVGVVACQLDTMGAGTAAQVDASAGTGGTGGTSTWPDSGTGGTSTWPDSGGGGTSTWPDSGLGGTGGSIPDGSAGTTQDASADAPTDALADGMQDAPTPDAAAGNAGSAGSGGQDAGEDAAPDVEAGPDVVDEPPPSCDDLFGAAAQYVYCEESATTCKFATQTGGGTCAEKCASLGSTCVNAWDNGNEPCVVISWNDDCNTQRSTEICECERP